MDSFTRDSECGKCKMRCIFSQSDNETQTAGHTREIKFNKGETIIKNGSFNTTIVFVKDGLLKQVMEGYNKKDLIVRFYGKGEYIGLTEVFGRNEINYTVTALKKSDVCMIEVSRFKNLLAGDSSLYEVLYRQFNHEYNFLYYRLGVMGTKNLQGRMAESIVYIARMEKKGLDIYQNITRKELAELSGMSVESMIRLLNEFKHDKLIEINGKHIVINKMEMLKILCRVG